MDREQLAKECLKIEKADGNVLEYLRSVGCISPWGTWYRLQKEELRRRPDQIKNGKGYDAMGMITLEKKKKAVDLAIRGISPIPYLRECGSKKPGVTWSNIMRALETADPAKYNMLTKMRGFEPMKEAQKAMEQPEVDMTIKAEDLAKTNPEPEMKLTIHAAEIADDAEPEEAIGAPIFCGTLHVSAVRDDSIGEFYYDSKFGVMDWRAPDGDEVSLNAESWRELIGKLPEIMKILGI